MKWTLILVVAATGCATADIVRTPGGGSGHYKFAPENDLAAAGIAHYSLRGVPQVIDMRRRDAFKRMHNACYGELYSIEREGPTMTGDAVVTGGPTVDGDWYIQFRCNHSSAQLSK